MAQRYPKWVKTFGHKLRGSSVRVWGRNCLLRKGESAVGPINGLGKADTTEIYCSVGRLVPSLYPIPKDCLMRRVSVCKMVFEASVPVVDTFTGLRIPVMAP